MQNKIVLRRSQRQNILWHFFVVLDHVPEGVPGKEEFAMEMLDAFGVPPAERPRWLDSICERLPDAFHELDANQFMAVFEQALPIEWYNDVQQVSVENTAELKRSVLAILAARTPEQLPKEVARLVIEDLKRVLGSQLEVGLVPGIAASLEEQFVRELWRSKDSASQQKLANSVLFELKSTARLELLESTQG